MGYAMAERLAKAGCDITVWNRTRAKAEPLAKSGAKVAASLAELAACDIVFTMVATGKDVKEVLFGPSGVLAAGTAHPKIVVDSTSISLEESAEIRAKLAKEGVQFLSAPVSGNAKVIKAGKLTVVASGPKDAMDAVTPYLAAIGQGVSYVGEGELSRIAKICHNVMLGVVTQIAGGDHDTRAEGRHGAPRLPRLPQQERDGLHVHALQDAGPGEPRFPRHLHAGASAQGPGPGPVGRPELGVPMPLATITRDMVQTLIGHGYADQDFSTLLLLEAKAAGIELKPENVEVGDGLS